jgi:hypothetical protein
VSWSSLEVSAALGRASGEVDWQLRRPALHLSLVRPFARYTPAASSEAARIVHGKRMLCTIWERPRLLQLLLIGVVALIAAGSVNAATSPHVSG